MLKTNNVSFLPHYVNKIFAVNPDAVNLTYEPAINEVVVPILPRDVCNEWIDTANVTEGMICAGFPEGGKDACQVC